MKIRKKLLTGILCATLLGGIGFYSQSLTELNVKANTTTQSNDQGKIIVHYVDQNGNPIRPDTVATGNAGTTYVADVPQIKGYTYASIENGQNNANGPQMVFGGGDPITSVMSMTIVYDATNSKAADSNKNPDSSTSNKNNSTSNSSSTSAPANNSKVSNGSKANSETNSNKNSSNSKVKPNSTSSSSNKQNTANSNDDNADNPDQKPKASKDTKAKTKTDQKAKADKKDKADKTKSDESKDHHSIWLIGGVILAVVVIIAVIWKLMKKPRSDRH
ncbi:MucBP domain-containing protein [Fructilactobacillus frigidiflavus]|uniref:MucBP domain-containing protein n=1 Tax=Fructilactobacillus frigidiflavus TaxID=3242688 RepID=UPI003756EFC4